MPIKISLVALAGLSVLLCGCKPSVPENSAMSCFNTSLYQPDNSYKLVSFKQDEPVMTIDVSFSNTQYKGEPAVLESAKLYVFDSDFTINQQLTATIDKENWQYLWQKNTMEYDGVHKESTYNPPKIIDYNFTNPMEQRAGQFSETSLFESDYSDPEPVNIDHEVVTQFVGIETIKTPAGTFDSCHMKVTSKSVDHNGEPKTLNEDQWYAQKLGVPVKITSGTNDVVIKLASATVDGETFTASEDIQAQLKSNSQ